MEISNQWCENYIATVENLGGRRMVFIGEKLNSFIPRIREIMINNDIDEIINLAKSQIYLGGHYIDINTDNVSNPKETMKMIVKSIMDRTDIRKLMIDSADPSTIEIGLSNCIDPSKTIINSMTRENEDKIIDLVMRFNAGLVIMTSARSNDSPEDRLNNAISLVDRVSNIIPYDKIYLDASVHPLAVESEAAMDTLRTARLLRNKYPEIHILCAISNVSFGLPKRSLINQSFVVGSILFGVDSFIMDVNNRSMIDLAYAANAISGNDEYCLEYIQYLKEVYSK